MVQEQQKEMNSREKILERIKVNQPKLIGDEIINFTPSHIENPVEKFKSTLVSVGGAVIEIQYRDDIKKNILALFPNASLVLSNLPELSSENTESFITKDPHSLANIKVAVLEGEFGVAENAAIWITNKTMLDPALPFICENLILLITKENILPTLHEAYNRIDKSAYHYGTFISGPSKTADIEQSLVLGAHGAKTMTVFIL